jgi:hypothetical protein
MTVMKHPIKKGPDGGKFQHGKGYDRYLLDGDRKVITGPQGGKFQRYGRNKKRYLLDL